MVKRLKEMEREPNVKDLFKYTTVCVKFNHDIVNVIQMHIENPQYYGMDLTNSLLEKAQGVQKH